MDIKVDIKKYMLDLGIRAKKASRLIARADSAAKDAALNAIADEILRNEEFLIVQNNKDLSAGQDSGLDAALLDRLELNSERIHAMAQGLRQIAALANPVGEISDLKYRPSGIQVGKMRVPLGVVGIIYESRPNVTADAAALCLKSGNAAILRGGSEAMYSNQAIAACIHTGLNNAGLSQDIIQVIETNDREAVGQLITMNDFIDVIVPRGGKGLIKRISQEATVAVIKHLHGICHVYIHSKADRKKAIDVAFNSKTQRYGTCNTMETLLLDRLIAKDILPELASLYNDKNVELRGCAETKKILTEIILATEEDWDTEYLAPILSIRIVENIDQAIEHIDRHGSGHTESIITEDLTLARRFLNEIDSSSVMVNASTRFADGFEYGLGAEIGISTDKIHVRGPVGLEGLTSQKYIVIGDGHIRT